MPILKAFLLETDPVSRKGQSGVRLLVKTQSGKSGRLFAPFEAYFYLNPRDLQVAAKEVPSAKAFLRGKQVGVKRVEKVHKTLAGKETEVVKVFAHSPADVPALREALRQWGETFEDNIPFTRRFIIDSGLVPSGLAEFTLAADKSTVEKYSPVGGESKGLPPLKLMAFDIETYNPAGVPNPKTDPAIMVSYALGKDGQKGEVLTYSKKLGNSGVKVLNDEKEMIEEFARHVRESRVDVLAGYNSDEFDLPYLLERSRVLRAELRLGRDSKPVTLRKLGLRRRAKISGRVHLDIFVPVSFLNFIGAYKFPRLTLGAVYKEMFGEEKLDIKKTEIWKVWDKGGAELAHLVEYSKADAEACLKITQKILASEIELGKVAAMTLFDITRATAGQMVESLLMRAAYERNEIVPNKPGYSTVQSRQDDAIQGAYVKMPSPGVYDKLAVFDFRSLYPSIITSHNIDPSTLNCECCPDSPNKAPTGVRFCTKKKGLVPETLGKVLKERFAIIDRMKKLDKKSEEYRQLDSRKWALKILANSFYGYLVYSRSRYYSRESGEATTAWARQYIQETIKKAEQAGFKVLYGDSVTSERCIPYLDSSGILRVEPVERIFEKYASKGVVSSGEKQVILNPGIKVLTANPQTGEAKWHAATEIIRHQNGKRIFRVRQKTGETRVTEDHSLIARNGNRLEERKPAELGNLPLAVLRSIPEVKPLEEIDLMDWLKDYAYTRKYKGSQKTSKLEVKDGKITFGWMKRQREPWVRRNYKAGTQELLALCRLLGAYIAEGSSSTPETTASRWGASISTSSEYWLNTIKADYLTVFGNVESKLIPSMRHERRLEYVDRLGMAHATVYRDETLKLQMMNQISSVVFKQLCGQKSVGKHLPEFIFHLPKECKLALLKEMIYGDGSTSFGPRYSEDYAVNNFRYTTNSLRLASGICVLLSQLGQNYSLRRDPKKEAYTISTCDENNTRLGTKITEENYGGFVYDFGVEGTHMFTDACGNVLLHNTDSVFLQMGDKSEKDILQFQKGINESLPGTMEFELEDFYPRGIFVAKKQGEKGAKKKYALINRQGAIKIRGFELVRRDWSGIARKTQREVLEILLKEGDLLKAKKLVQAKMEELREGKVPISELTITTQLRKSTSGYEVKSPELGAVQHAREKGVRVEEHAVVEYVITRQGGKTISERAQLAELVKEGDYDVEYYTNNQLLPAVLKILGALGVDEDDLKQKGKQTGLGSWG